MGRSPNALTRQGAQQYLLRRDGHLSTAAADLDRRNRTLEEQLRVLQQEQQESRQALFAAAQFQRKLCAPGEVRCGPFEIAGENFPVRQISGDFHTVMDLNPALAVAVGDISGKGLPAGLWFAHLMGLTRLRAESERDPGAALAAINEDLCRLRPEAPLATLFLARLEASRNSLLYCNAGQPPALLLHEAGTIEWLQDGGPLLGALRGARFECGQVEFGPGDTLVAYSDGIIECRNSQEEEFGRERLLETARRARNLSAHGLLFSILGAAEDFAGGQPMDDDLTVMVVQRLH